MYYNSNVLKRPEYGTTKVQLVGKKINYHRASLTLWNQILTFKQYKGTKKYSKASSYPLFENQL